MKLTTVLLVIAFFLLVGCSYDQTVGKDGNQKEVIEIGIVYPLTGKLSDYGKDAAYAFDIAVEEVNNEKDFQIKAIYEDSKGETVAATNIVKKFIEVDGINIIIGPARSNCVLAVAPIAEANKVILFAPISSSPDVTDAGDFIFRNRETSAVSGRAMAEFLIEKDVKKVATMAAQAANSLAYVPPFIERFEELGGEIVASDSYSEDAKDFRTEITKLMDQDAEAVYVSLGTGVDGGLVTKQLRQMSFTGIIAGSNAVEGTDFLTAAGDASEGVFYTSPTFDINDPKIKPYAEKYRQKAGKDSTAYAANSYDAVHLIADAIESCNGDDSECIRDYLYSVKDYPGMGGLTTFDENGDVIKPVAIKTIKNGEFVIYEE